MNIFNNKSTDGKNNFHSERKYNLHEIQSTTESQKSKTKAKKHKDFGLNQYSALTKNLFGKTNQTSKSKVLKRGMLRTSRELSGPKDTLSNHKYSRYKNQLDSDNPSQTEDL